EGEAAFQIEGIGTVTTRGALSAAALDELSRAWPASLPFEDLARALLAAGLIEDSAEGRHKLAGPVMALLTLSALSVSVAPARGPPWGPPPAGPRSARLLAAREGWLPTLRHTAFRLDEVGRLIAPLLDGTHDRSALLEVLLREHRAGRLPVRYKGA